jgi:hypothetical protein
MNNDIAKPQDTYWPSFYNEAIWLFDMEYDRDGDIEEYLRLAASLKRTAPYVILI